MITRRAAAGAMLWAAAAFAAPAGAAQLAQRQNDAASGPPAPPAAMVWHADPAGRRAPIAPREYVRQREGVFGGVPLAYTVVAGDTLIEDPLGNPDGSIFSFSYMAKTAPGAQRPVIFIFNGGPGSSSLWLHIGALGPRKVAFRDGAPSQVPPYRLVDNSDSPLAVADLVFIDPVGTGFSRYSGKGGPQDFYGREEDVHATIEFIQSWLRRNDRWNSPKFLLGESYGTQRAAMVARGLFGGVFQGGLRGIALNGVIMLGGAGGLATPGGNDVYLATYPCMAAAAWYHDRAHKAGRSFAAYMADAEHFAHDELIPGLDRWNTLDATTRATLAEKDAAYIGLPAAYLLAHGLRIAMSDFTSRLLADRHEEIGLYDGRYTLPDTNGLHDPVADDPAMGQYSPVFISGFNTYLRDDLGIAMDDDYVAIDWVNVNFPFAMRGDEGTDPGADLAATLRRNPDMRLFSGQGWFDMLGSLGEARYGIAQRRLPAGQIVQKDYWSGHMVYVGDAGITLAGDLKAFIVQAAQGRDPGIAGAEK